MNHHRIFWRTFFIAFAVQLVIYAFYWFIVLNGSGSESAFQKIILTIYHPILFVIYEIQEAMDMHGWGALGFMLIFSPLIGSLVYSLIIAFIVLLYRKATTQRNNSVTND